MFIQQTKQLYKIGDTVVQSGNYVCVPCGFVQYFDAGEQFTTCIACFAGTDNGPEDYRTSEIEFWEFMN
jgi:hypothetical protein